MHNNKTKKKKTLYKEHLLGLKYNVKLASNFHLILLDIPSSLILSVRNRGWEILRNRQNLLRI